MNLWFTEEQTAHVRLGVRVKEVLHSEETPFQKLAVIDTEQFGRVLLLDDMFQTTERDEFVYHEMIAHIAMVTHPNPWRVAVIGGGDGGAVREILKHPEVESVTLIEIDERVVEASRRFLPTISSGLDDERVTVLAEDGIVHIRETKAAYDVVLVDSTEPVGAAIGLFTAEFYEDVAAALREDGLMVAQTESPFFNAELLRNAHGALKQVFPITKTYLASIPTYPSGLWSFTLGSKVHDPQTADVQRLERIETKYVTPELFHGAFALPRFVQTLLDA